MKRALSFLVVLTAVSTLTAADNLIQNGQFTEPVKDGKIPGWVKWPEPLYPDAEIAVDTTVSVSGGASLRITNGRECLYTRADQLHIPCKPHTRYVASFYARGRDVSTSTKGGARMFIGPDGDLQRPIIQLGPGIEICNRDVPNPWNYEWTRYESDVFDSGDSKELGVTIYLDQAGGTVWFDNVEIFEYTPTLEQERRSSRVSQLIRNDVKTVKTLAPELRSDLMKFDKSLNEFQYTPRDLRAGMPFYEPQQKLGEMFSKVLAKRFPGKTVVVSQVSEPLAHQSAFVLPNKAFSGTITVAGLKNEPESFALNLTNVTNQTQTAEISLPENLPMSVRLAVHVETDRITAVDDALVLQRPDASGAYRINIPAGMTRQVYFTADLKQTASGKLTVAGETFDLKLAPIAAELPEELPMNLFSYAYLEHPAFTVRRYEATQKMMKVMHDNVAHPYQFHSPQPVFDENGNFQPEKMDWSRMDKLLAMKTAPHSVFLYLAVRSDPHLTITLGQDHGKAIAPFSPEWERRLSLWLKELVRGFAGRGIGCDRLMVASCDEPGEAHIDAIVKVAQAVHRIDPKIRVYNNFTSHLSEAAVLRMAEAVDILSPEVNALMPEMYSLLRKTGKEIWCYHVQSRNNDGASMRDRFKVMKRENIRGFSYWCFVDTNPDWEPAGTQSYSAVYTGDADEWTPSKRSEGIKDGMEDYTLLALLEAKNPALYQKLVKSNMSRHAWRKVALEALEK